MGTSFVSISKRGFWMRDGVLELWLRLAALQIEEPTADDSVAYSVRNQWLLASRGYFGGCVPDGIESAVSTQEGKKVVTDAIEALRTKLVAAPATIDHHALNLLGFGSPFLASVDTWRMIEVCDAMRALLDGKITADASSTAFMPGCGKVPIQSPVPTRGNGT
ncbi:MAG TPA: hypothetical protein VHD32_04300 [Candidatus Didemnitutus sp.]|nr:hypothetical protein [Candidatus Didemnitutus sp.]